MCSSILFHVKSRFKSFFSDMVHLIVIKGKKTRKNKKKDLKAMNFVFFFVEKEKVLIVLLLDFAGIFALVDLRTCALVARAASG